MNNGTVLVVHSVVSDSLRPHGLQHTRLPCPSPSPRICSNSSSLSQGCHPTSSSSVIPFSFLPSIFSSIKVFSNETSLCIRWPKCWSFSFSISPSNESSLEGNCGFRLSMTEKTIVNSVTETSWVWRKRGSIDQVLREGLSEKVILT